jgi:hypothetical protein
MFIFFAHLWCFSGLLKSSLQMLKTLSNKAFRGLFYVGFKVFGCNKFGCNKDGLIGDGNLCAAKTSGYAAVINVDALFVDEVYLGNGAR